MSTPQETNPITCEFAIPCTTTPLNPSTGLPDPPPRKVISHIFGRNKSATKRFPPHVWVHYCRKHYQRARYRATQWPFIQCELLLDSLQRMEAWGGVRSFTVVLRKREVARLTPEGAADDPNPDPDPASHGGTTSSAGDKPKPITQNKNKTKPQAKPQANSKSKGKGKAKSTGQRKGKSKRKSPRVVAAPVPGWLRVELGPNKSFGEIRALLRRVMDDLAAQQARGRTELVRFPDIEILPTFYEWVDRAGEESAEGDSGLGPDLEGEGDEDVSVDWGSEGDDEGDEQDQDEDESESDAVSPRDMRARRMSRVSRKGAVRKL